MPTQSPPKPQKGDIIEIDGERLVVVAVEGCMVEFKGLKVSGRVNASTWTGMQKDAQREP